MQSSLKKYHTFMVLITFTLYIRNDECYRR